MASYGPPGGSYPGQQPGQPPESWGEGQREYGQPADPWGGEAGATSPGYGYDPGYGQPGDPYPDQPGDPGYGQPGYGQPGEAYPGGPGYGGPEYTTAPYAAPDHGEQREYGAPPPTGPVWQAPAGGPAGRGRSPSMVVAIVAVLAALLLGGGLAGYLAYRATADTPAGGAGSPGPTQSPTGRASATPATTPTGPVASGDSRFVIKGQCVVNDGTSDKPVMRVVPCGPNTYEVLARFDGTIKHQEKCPQVPGYEYHYYYDSELDDLDFVLCLKKRR